MVDGSKRTAIDEMIELPALSDARISPDGSAVAFVVRTTDWDANAYKRCVWVADAQGGKLRAVAQNLDASTHPRWTADGRLLGESGVLELDGAGEATFEFRAPERAAGARVVLYFERATGTMRMEGSVELERVVLASGEREKQSSGTME